MSHHESPVVDRLQRVARIARYATVILMLAMFAATHTPTVPVPIHFSYLDKIVHCVIYMTLTVMALTSLELSIGILRPQHFFSVWLIGTLYGAFDEVTQIPVGRHCDVLDWISDIVGIVLGIVLFRLLRPLIYWLASVKVTAG